jgi:hypothetical protein
MKALIVNYHKFTARQAEIMEDPTELDIEKFHETCPVFHSKVIAVVEVMDEAVQFCSGDKAERNPFLSTFINKWFNWVCRFNKDQLVGEFS